MTTEQAKELYDQDLADDMYVSPRFLSTQEWWEDDELDHVYGSDCNCP